MGVARRNEAPEVVERAEVRMHRLVAALLRTDRIDRADIAVLAFRELFLPLRLVRPIDGSA